MFGIRDTHIHWYSSETTVLPFRQSVGVFRKGKNS